MPAGLLALRHRSHVPGEAAGGPQRGHHAAAEEPHAQRVEHEARLVFLRGVLYLVGDHVVLYLQVHEPLEGFFGLGRVERQAGGLVRSSTMSPPFCQTKGARRISCGSMPTP